MDKIQGPKGETLYIKYDFMGARIVNPINNEDGSYNIFNLLTGGKRNLVNLIVILIAILGFMYMYNHDIEAVHDRYGRIATGEYVCVRQENYVPDFDLPDEFQLDTASFPGGDYGGEST